MMTFQQTAIGSVGPSTRVTALDVVGATVYFASGGESLRRSVRLDGLIHVYELAA